MQERDITHNEYGIPRTVMEGLIFHQQDLTSYIYPPSTTPIGIHLPRVGELFHSLPHRLPNHTHEHNFQAPTFRAVSGHPWGFELLVELAHRKALDSRIAAQMVGHFVSANGSLTAPGWDRLAVSRLPVETIAQLSNDGYGCWPSNVRAGESVIPRSISASLNPQQEKLLATAKNTQAHANGALWFKPQDLIETRAQLGPETLPTLREVLTAFARFAEQEGYYPDSKGKWFRTGSYLEYSLTNLYQKAVSNVSARDILIDAFINLSPYADTIRYYLAQDRDLVVRRKSGGKIELKMKDPIYGGKGLEITDAAGHSEFVIKYPAAERHDPNALPFLQVHAPNREMSFFSLSSGEITYHWYYLIGYIDRDVPRDWILKEIEQKKSQMPTIFEGSLKLPLVLYVNGNGGIKVGLAFDEFNSFTAQSGSHTIWVLGENPIGRNSFDGMVKVDYLSMIRKYLEKQVVGLSIVSDSKQPKIYTDEGASQ